MYFRNLPIDFDAQGQAFLRGDGQTYPFARKGVAAGSGARERQKSWEDLAERSRVRSFDVDPVTRVAGALSFHTVIDFDERRCVDARLGTSSFRGYEVILRDREPS